MLLWRSGLDWDSYREVREYQAGVLVAIRNTLRDLDFPDPDISIVINFYGEADNNGFLLEEVLWAEELLAQRTRHWEEVD